MNVKTRNYAGAQTEFCSYCGASQPGPHGTTDCPGDAAGMQRRIAVLEASVQQLKADLEGSRQSLELVTDLLKSLTGDGK